MVFGIVEDIVGGGEDLIDQLTGQTAVDAAKDASRAQLSATALAIEEARQQREDEMRRYDQAMAEYERRQGLGEAQQMQQYGLLAPYMQAGQGALYEMMALSGIGQPGSNITLDLPSRPVSLGTGSAGGQPPPGNVTLDPVSSPVSLMSTGKQPVTGGMDKIGERPPPYIPKERNPPDTVLPEIEAAVNPYAGMSGADAQQAAISRISESPILQELMAQQEDAILQNAAATGGLRGGNIQDVLARYRPQMIQSEIDKQYSRLGGLSGIGQQSIVGAPATAMPGTPGALGRDPSVANLYGQMGAQQAGGILSGAQMQQSAIGNLLNLGGTILGAG